MEHIEHIHKYRTYSWIGRFFPEIDMYIQHNPIQNPSRLLVYFITSLEIR